MKGILSNRSRLAVNPIHEDDITVERLVKKGKKVIKLNQGDPAVYFRTPSHVIEAYVRALRNGHTGYSSIVGLEDLREAIAKRYKRLYNVRMGPERVVITQGVSEALLFINASVINIGEGAVLFKPYYPSYTRYLWMYGGKEVLMNYTEEKEWGIDVDSVMRGVRNAVRKGKRIKYMLVTSPNNPTGTVLSRKEMKGIVDIANEFGMMLICDEIYDELVFNGAKFTSLSEVARGVPHIVLNGASKNFDATGFRIGFAIAPEEDRASTSVLNSMTNYAAMRLSANTPAQYAVCEAISNLKRHRKEVNRMALEIEKRVNFACRLINESEFMHTVVPHGAFYIFPRLNMKRLKLRSDKEFVGRLLRQKLVYVTRGSGFGEANHIRIVSLANKDLLGEAIGRIEDFCRSNRKR